MSLPLQLMQQSAGELGRRAGDGRPACALGAGERVPGEQPGARAS